jgi:hypothetical protein
MAGTSPAMTQKMDRRPQLKTKSPAPIHIGTGDKRRTKQKTL